MPAILILAAGSSSRMRGGDKLMEQIDDRPQIARAVMAAAATGLPVLVALDPARTARIAALAGLNYQSVAVPDAASGMAASLRRGLVAAPPGAVLLHLADLPEIDSADLSRMIAEHHATPDLILRATDAAGRPGHPVLIPDWARPALAGITGDSGARNLLRTEAARLRMVPLPGLRATTDLDTPEDWAAWRAARLQS
ncbi:nucleotidyltransferase family protein [Szabonella alba]|uniref:Nucleotidyltransferase family protein n=1 Tax=Szabonella alba TaxID=2804194 RepID=A0A8K0Y004_9RHOB|nr:nucleotidyltransferase family protein [Szabonella alba]MBL4917685.1 nucleotidyltransferase family protein [Szabonella alba]